VHAQPSKLNPLIISGSMSIFTPLFDDEKRQMNDTICSEVIWFKAVALSRSNGAGLQPSLIAVMLVLTAALLHCVYYRYPDT
jgi:hypothetical protein